MNKSTLLAFYLIAIFCSGCGDGDVDITGIYQITSIATTECNDPNLIYSFDLEKDNCITDLGIEICIDGTITLTQEGTFNGSFTITSLGFAQNETFDGNFDLDGSDITICDQNDCEMGSFEGDGNKIIISFPEDQDNCVLRLTGEK